MADFKISLCMKDPGPCRNCGDQTSLMYAAFRASLGGERISDALCQGCMDLGAALILYPGWSKEVRAYG